MIKYLLLLAILIISRLASAHNNVGQQKRILSLDHSARIEVRKMQEYIRFNEFEYIQIKKLTELKLQEVEQARQTYATDFTALQLKLNQVEQNYKLVVSSYLNDTQKTAFAAYSSHTIQHEFAVQ